MIINSICRLKHHDYLKQKQLYRKNKLGEEQPNLANKVRLLKTVYCQKSYTMARLRTATRHKVLYSISKVSSRQKFQDRQGFPDVLSKLF